MHGLDSLTTCDKHCIKNERGAVAQLGERMTGSHEAEGSIPFSSTNFFNYLPVINQNPSVTIVVKL